jgi:hypothetical protein
MLRACAPLLGLLALAGTHALYAATAYKCVDAHGAISFQDQPCRSGSRQQTIALPDDPPVRSKSAETNPPEPPPPEPTAPAAPVASKPATPPPSFYLCTRYDGSRYMSDSGQGGSALVPLGVLGVPGRSLADAYGGSNGIGVSAPGLRTIPHQPAASVPFGGTSTWIDDECHHASPREACAYLRKSLDDVRYKLTKAFSDTTPELKRQEADILDRLHGC